MVNIQCKLITLEPRFYDMARGQQNHIIKSGYCWKQTPDLTIWQQATKNILILGYG